MSDHEPITREPVVPTQAATYPAAPTQPGGQPYPMAGQPYPMMVAQPKTNTLAIVSLVFSLLGISFLPFLGSIVGVITGHIALGQIKRTGEGGHGLALTGVIIGWVVIGLFLIGMAFAIVAWIGLIAAAGAAGAFSTTG